MKEGKKCLHCCLWDAINAWCADNDLVVANGQFIYDERPILGACTQILGEMIAGIPERRDRKLRLAAVNELVRDAIIEKRNSGQHPVAEKMYLQ